MSAIDNAFIRAYTTERTSQSAAGKSAAETAPAKATPVVAAKPAAPPTAPMSLSAARAARAAASEVSPPEAMPALRRTPAAAPAPHFRPAKIATVAPVQPTPAEFSSEPEASEVERNSFRSSPSGVETQAAVPATPESSRPQRAAYEVDQFEWPALCDTLLTQLAGGLDHLAGELVTESALGRKVIAITGLRRGEGRTTLILALARRLAAGGVKVLLADGDLESPQVAAQLGLDIEQGWDEATAGGLTIWDTMIESIGEQLTVLPLAARRVGIAAARERQSGGGHSKPI